MGLNTGNVGSVVTTTEKCQWIVISRLDLEAEKGRLEVGFQARSSREDLKGPSHRKLRSTHHGQEEFYTCLPGIKVPESDLSPTREVEHCLGTVSCPF